MAFKLEMEEAPQPSRTRNHDPNLVKVADQFAAEVKKGNLKLRIPATGDTKASTEAPKGKQSNREKSARAEAGQIAHYLRTKHNLEIRTLWDREKNVVYVAPKVKEAATTNGNGNG